MIQMKVNHELWLPFNVKFQIIRAHDKYDMRSKYYRKYKTKCMIVYQIKDPKVWYAVLPEYNSYCMELIHYHGSTNRKVYSN